MSTPTTPFNAPVTYTSPKHEKTPTELTNLRATTLKDVMLGMLGSYTPDWSGSVRVEALPDVKPAFGGHYLHAMVFHDGTGVALGREPWTHEPLVYTFGCDHAYTELGMAECRARGIYHAGRCWHVHECTKCHHVSAVDSSD